MNSHNPELPPPHVPHPDEAIQPDGPDFVETAEPAAGTLEREPLPWMSDLIFHTIVEGMRHAEQAVFTGAFDGEERRWPRERLTITELGRAVLSGEVDWLSLRPPARWLGGVLIPGAAPCWRWDDGTGAVVNR